MHIQGSCHCGNITFDLDWRPDPVEIPARACGCTFCTRHGGVWTSSPAGLLVIRTRDPGRSTGYAFGSRTARFHICAGCGVVPLVTSEIEQRVYAVVNVNTFENVPPSLLNRSVRDYGAEDVGSRLARRQRTWIPNVRFINGVTPH